MANPSKRSVRLFYAVDPAITAELRKGLVQFLDMIILVFSCV